MTNVVRGAGRARHSARAKKHNEQDKRVVGGNRDAALEAAAEPLKKTTRKRAAANPAPAPATSQSTDWDKTASLGANVDRLKTAGVTWKAIAAAATANGHDTPYPDGGKLLRARKQFLAGTEGQEKPARAAKGVARRKAPKIDPEPGEIAATAEERIAAAVAGRTVPWEDGVEHSEADLIKMLEGRQITWVSGITGNEASCRVLASVHSKIEEGKAGPYITFVSQDGPFMNISLSRIIRVK